MKKKRNQIKGKDDFSASEEERRAEVVRAHVLRDMAKRDESLSRSQLPNEWTRSQQNSVEDYDDWQPVPPTTSRSGQASGRRSVTTKSPIMREIELR